MTLTFSIDAGESGRQQQQNDCNCKLHPSTNISVDKCTKLQIIHALTATCSE